MSKTIKKFPLPIITQADEKSIKKLYENLKKNYNNSQLISQIINSEKSTELIKLILTKKQKSENEIFIINIFLKQLHDFMSILNKNNENEDNKEKILNKISSDLSLEVLPKNSFLMKVGEVGKNFFVTLSGKVTILVPKNYHIQMTENQYKYHLKFLYNNDEKFLLDKTFMANKHLFKFQLKDIQINEEELIIEIPLKITLEEYISRINGENLPNIKKSKIDNNQIHKLKLYGYYKVLDLIQGSSFGEIALINDNNQRTATIFVKENSVFGVLKSHEYKNTMKKIQEKIKLDNINFIYSNLKIFNCISLNLFTQNYWNYFISGKIFKGEYLFSYNEKRNKVFFIQEGEIKLETNLNINKINNYINKLSESKDIVKKKPTLQNENIILFICKKGDILGLKNILFDEHFICNGICCSKYCNYFSIDIHVLNEMKNIFDKVEENLNKVEKKKVDLMLNRLLTIKSTDESSLKNQIYKEKLELKDSNSNIKSYFDTKGEGFNVKEAKIKKLSEKLNIFNSNIKKRFSQFFQNNLKPKMSKILTNRKNTERLSIFSHLALKFDHETGNIIDRKEKRKQTLNHSKSLSEISYTNSNYSSSLMSEENKKNNNNENNSNNKFPKLNLNIVNNNYNINNYNYHNGYNTLRNNNINYNYFNNINNKNQNNDIQYINLNKNNSNKNLYNKTYNTISYNNYNNIKKIKGVSSKKIAVVQLRENYKSNLKKFNPIETAKIQLGDDIKEKNKEEEIKNSISLTEPNNLESKEFFNKIIKKEDNVTNILKRISHKKILSDNFISNLRLFDNEMEKTIYGKKFHKYNKSYSGFKAKKFPPHFLLHGKKLILKSNKK